MKKKSVFSQIMTVVIVALIGIVLTLVAAFFAGTKDATLFDLSNLNLANFVPIILIGGFITCVAVGITVLIASKNVFLKIRDYFLNDNNDGGKKE